MSVNFETTTFGKWILTGEHSVIRGYDALVFPYTDKTLNLKYIDKPTPLELSYSGDKIDILSTVVKPLFAVATSLLQKSMDDIQGHFLFENHIPLGAGLGASAALSVAVTRFFIFKNWLNQDQEYVFAKALEDYFHGQSSGVDIIGVSHDKPMHFNAGTFSPIQMTWSPNFKLTTSESHGYTADCVREVQNLWQRDAQYAGQLDVQMQQASTLAMQALKTPNDMKNLQIAMQLAASCFDQWGLTTEHLKMHLLSLTNKGAVAAKPTGSGKGGYVLSLWT